MCDGEFKINKFLLTKSLLTNVTKMNDHCHHSNVAIPYIANCSRWKSFTVFTD